MQKILVTGVSGFVGSRFLRRWMQEYNMLAPSHNELDITSEESVRSYFLQHAPQVVLHLAALSNTLYCQQNPDDSYKVNVQGAVNIAKASVQCGAKLIFFSSDQVYNGNSESGLLSEDVAVAPENVYGKHKLLAEQKILEISPSAVVLRASWMYDCDSDGLPLHDNFVLNIARAVKEKRALVFPVREYRGITWVREVVELLPSTFSLAGGIYNYGAPNTMNTYETACCYCEMLAGLQSGALLLPDYERYPRHERNLSMSVEKVFRASGGAVCFSTTLNGLMLFGEYCKG